MRRPVTVKRNSVKPDHYCKLFGADQPEAHPSRLPEHSRHRTLSLYAAFNPQTGEVIGQTAPRHTSQEFVAFLGEVVASQPCDREVHIILDNLSAHQTPLVRQFLAAHPNVQLHFTPTYSSCLNHLVFRTATRYDRPGHLYFCHGPAS